MTRPRGVHHQLCSSCAKNAGIVIRAPPATLVGLMMHAILAGNFGLNPKPHSAPEAHAERNHHLRGRPHCSRICRVKVHAHSAVERGTTVRLKRMNQQKYLLGTRSQRSCESLDCAKGPWPD